MAVRHPATLPAALVATLGQISFHFWRLGDRCDRYFLEVDVSDKTKMFLLDDYRAVCFGGRWHGWEFVKHPDGHWVSARKLPETEPTIDPLFSMVQSTPQEIV
jgi:hypothetical protein